MLKNKALKDVLISWMSHLSALSHSVVVTGDIIQYGKGSMVSVLKIYYKFWYKIVYLLNPSVSTFQLRAILSCVPHF